MRVLLYIVMAIAVSRFATSFSNRGLLSEPRQIERIVSSSHITQAKVIEEIYAGRLGELEDYEQELLDDAIRGLADSARNLESIQSVDNLHAPWRALWSTVVVFTCLLFLREIHWRRRLKASASNRRSIGVKDPQ